MKMNCFFVFLLTLFFAGNSASGSDTVSSSYLIGKRDGDDLRLLTIVNALKAKLNELQLNHVYKEEYFQHILRLGSEKEFQNKVGIARKLSLLDRLSKSSVAYKGKVRFDDSPAAKRNVGEIFGSVMASPDGRILITIMSGHSDWLPSNQDLCALCDAMLTMTEKIFYDAKEYRVFSARLMLGVSWDELALKTPAPGCFSALYAMILPSQHITVSNMGSAWMGVFRNGKLIHSTHGTVCENGTPHRLCVSGEGLPEMSLDDIEDVSENYEWDAKSGDIVVAVSHGVRQVLTSEQIFASMKTIEELGLDEYIPENTEKYGLRAMGIVKAAQVASNGPQQDDMTAMVVEI